MPGRYSTHDLLRGYATELAHRIDPVRERDAAVRRLLDHAGAVALAPASPGVTPEALADPEPASAWFTAEHAMLLATVRLAAVAGFDTHVWQPAWSMSSYLDRRVRWADRVGARQTAPAHTRLGLGRALDLFESIGEQQIQSHAHLDLAVQGEQTAALHHAERALGLSRRACHQLGQANALNGVGWFHAQPGDHRAVLPFCQDALALHQELGDRAAEGGSWYRLGYLHQQLGRADAAIDCYRRAVAALRDVGDRHLEAETLTRLREACQAAGDDAGAEDARRRAAEIHAELADQT